MMWTELVFISETHADRVRVMSSRARRVNTIRCNTTRRDEIRNDTKRDLNGLGLL